MIEKFGIVANCIETDRVFRKGAKAWLFGGTGGEGWYRFQWIAKSKGGRNVSKWAPTSRFDGFRAAFIPPHMLDRVWYITGTRQEMEAKAIELNEFANTLRTEKPNRLK